MHILPEIEQALSAERFATYLSNCQQNQEQACALYLWNLEVSSAFFPWLSMVEVVLRNRIHTALTAIHGAEWPWENGFERTLPTSGRHYSALDNLQKVREKHQHSRLTGKVVADLSFAFWQHLLTKRYAAPIWNKHLHRAFPHINSGLSTAENIKAIFDSIDHIRNLRNRIAHHEPIYNRDLCADYQNIQNFLLLSQSTDFITWMKTIRSPSPQTDYLSELINRRP